jgi:hypothetical protein
VHEIFLSHAAADRALTDDLKRMLQASIGLAPDDFFFSSGVGTGVPTGESFIDYIRQAMRDAQLVVAVITPAYAQSPFCLAELGATWALGPSFFPLAAPQIDRGRLGATLTGIQVERIDADEALAGLHQRVCEILGRPMNAPAFQAEMRLFAATLPTRLGNLAKPSVVDHDLLAQAEQARDTAVQQLLSARRVSRAPSPVRGVAEGQERGADGSRPLADG